MFTFRYKLNNNLNNNDIYSKDNQFKYGLNKHIYNYTLITNMITGTI